MKSFFFHRFPSIFQLKHVVTLKLLWISLQANADIDDDASDEDNDRVLFKQSTESSGGNEKEEEREDKLDGTYYSDEQRTSEKEIPQSLLSVPVLPNGENPEGRSNTNDGNSTNTCNSLSVTADDNVANNTNFSNITNESNTSNKLSATLGWIHEKVHMKNVTFRSESERKEWMNALKKSVLLSKAVNHVNYAYTDVFDRISYRLFLLSPSLQLSSQPFRLHKKLIN